MADIRKIISEAGGRVLAPPSPYVKCERRVLSNIAASKDARAAIINIAGDNESLISCVIDNCVIARVAMEEFPRLVVEKRVTAEQLRRARQSMEDLRRLLLAADAVLGGTFSGIEIVRSNDQVAIDYVTKLIEEQLAIVEASKHDIGVTRKSLMKEAAENAAIGWLAQTVRHNTGKPFARQVAKLAEVAFDIGAVTEDRVRKVLKTRLQKVVHSTPK